MIIDVIKVYLFVSGLAVVVIALIVILTAVCITRVAFKHNRTISRYDVSQNSIISRGYRDKVTGEIIEVGVDGSRERYSRHSLNDVVLISDVGSRRSSSRSESGTVIVKTKQGNSYYSDSQTAEQTVEYISSGYEVPSSCCSSTNGTLKRHRNSAVAAAIRKQSSSSLLSNGSGMLPLSGQFPPLPPIPGSGYNRSRDSIGSITPVDGGTWRRGVKVRSESTSGSVRSYASSKYGDQYGRGSQRSRCGSSGRILTESYTLKSTKSRPRMPYDFVEGVG